VEIIQECLTDAGLPHIPIHRPKTTAEFFDLVSGTHVLLGVRLHSVVLGSVVGAVPVMVAYRDKCWDFTESLGLQDLTVNFQETAGPVIRDAYERAFDEAAQRRNVMFAQVQHWRQKQIEFASRVLTVFTGREVGSEAQNSASAVLGD
jgi:polysaccharide pyruvyl transferase WcaK-like protein